MTYPKPFLAPTAYQQFLQLSPEYPDWLIEPNICRTRYDGRIYHIEHFNGKVALNAWTTLPYGHWKELTSYEVNSDAAALMADFRVRLPELIVLAVL